MSNLFSHTKKAVMAAAAVATLATGATVASTGSAEAQWRGKHYAGQGWRAHRGYAYRPHYRGNRGFGVAAGIIGGLAAGALIAGASNAYAAPSYSYGYAPAYQPTYSYGYAPAYYGGNTYYSAPTYYAQPVYQPSCYTRRIRERIDYDTVVIRRVRVCN